MKLKKANAFFGLLTILLLLVHAGYEMYAYVNFVYNPGVTKLLSYLLLGALIIHIILGMSIMMFSRDTADLLQYPKENRSTILQRGSAIAMLALLFGHMKAYDILTSHFGGKLSLFLAIVIQALFFASVFLHIGTSFSKAFVTLGLLSSLKVKKGIDLVVWVICIISFILILGIIIQTYGMLWNMPA